MISGMKRKLGAIVIPGLGALLVTGLFLFAALWVNGTFDVATATAIALLLGVATFSAMRGSPSRRAS